MPSIRSFCAIVVLSALLVTALVGQPSISQAPYRFHTLGVNDGMSQGFVNAITQDSLGFMWFATNDGLTRYDGYTPEIIQPDVVDTLVLHDHAVLSILSHTNRTIIVGLHAGGIRALDLGRMKFRQLSIAGSDPRYRHDQVVQLLHDHQRHLLAVTSSRLLRYDSSQQSFQPIFSTQATLTWAAIAADRAIWVTTNGQGLYRVDPARGTARRIHLKTAGVPTDQPDFLRRTIIDNRGILWVASVKTLLGILPEARRAVEEGTDSVITAAFVEPSATPFTILSDEGRIWFTSVPGVLSVIDPVTGLTAGISSNPLDPLSLAGGYVPSMYRDRGGIVWVGTSGNGVSRMATSYRRFPSWKLDAPLSSQSIRVIREDRRGRIWVGGYSRGTSAGLDVIDEKQGRTTRFTVGRGRAQLPVPNVWTIFEEGPDRGGALLLAAGNAVLRLDPTTLIAEQLPQIGLVEPYGVRSLYRSHDGRLWVGTQQGLYLFDDRAGRFVRPPIGRNNRPGQIEGIMHASTFSDLTEVGLAPGILWCSTNDGLVAYELATGDLTVVSEGRTAHELTAPTVLTFRQDRKDRLWLTTGGAGFARVTLRTDRPHPLPRSEDLSFRFYGMQDGLPNDFIYGIVEGDDEGMWMSTNRGLARFDPETERFRPYDLSDGLQSLEFNMNAFSRGRDGRTFFGGVQGVNHFYPRLLTDNHTVPEVVITGFRVMNKPYVTPEAVPYMREIVVGPDALVVTFEFVALEFTAPEKNRYRYQLLGFDDRWMDAGTNRSATYTNLDPGTYTFRVTGSNNDGVWNPAGASIRLVVLPPFWKTLWFRSFILLAVAGLFVGGVWYRGRRMAARNRELEERVRERTSEWEAANSELEAFSYTVSHDLRAPVRAINGYTRMLMEEHLAHLPPDAQRMLNVIATRTKRMGDMIDDLLTFSRTGRQAIIHARIEMTDLVRSVAADLVPSDTQVTIVVQDLPPVLGDSALIRQVWINLIANAVKFSSGVDRPSITISGRTETDTVVYSIKDNGVGFDMAYQHKLFGVFERLHSQEEFEGTGVGLAIVARVIKRHGGRIWAESGPGQGATFSFELPIVPPASV